MKLRALLGLVGWMCCWAAAGVAADSSGTPAASDVAARARIQRERQATQSALDRGQRQCASTFAVNDCLREVKTRYRESMDELHRQEVVLNDAQRQQQAEAQRQRVEKNQTQRETSSQTDDVQIGKSAHDGDIKKVNKQQAAQQSQSAAEIRAAQSEQKRKQQVRLNQERAARARLDSDKQKAFDKKHAQAVQHQADLRAQQAQKTKPAADPLPPPP